MCKNNTQEHTFIDFHVNLWSFRDKQNHGDY